MKALFVLSLILATAFSTTVTLEKQLLKDLFNNWRVAHQKAYSSIHEQELRFRVFTKNYLEILEFNAAQDDVILALNHFADLTSSEFKAKYTGLLPSSNGAEAETEVFDVEDLPASVDWRTQGAVTPVKNQGQCGSCWAFSAVGSLEGFYKINGNPLTPFSEQNLVDCVTVDQGCNGGYMWDALEYVAENGIETEADYPYKAKDGKCVQDQAKSIKVNTGYKNVTIGSDQLKAALVQQPVSVGIQANQLVFQFYFGGVISNYCGDKIDHGVLAVGYDMIKGKEAFIVKNSWGNVWGAQGYVYISTDGTKNKGNGVCGILSFASYPTK